MHATITNTRRLTVTLVALAALGGVASSASASEKKPEFVAGTYFGGKDSEIDAKTVRARGGGAFLGGTTDSPGLASKHKDDDKWDDKGDTDALIVRFDDDGDRKWSRYVGGKQEERLLDLAADEHNATYLVGFTRSDDGIASKGAEQDDRSEGQDGFIVKLDRDGDRIWGTYLGGNGDDQIRAVVVDEDDDIYVCGSTTSKNKIATDNSEQDDYRGDGDGFVAKYDGKDGDLRWSRYVGGKGDDRCNGITVDDEKVYITGTTTSKEKIFDKQDDKGDGDEDVFVARLDGDDGDVKWARRFGGERDDRGQAIAVDQSGDVYVAGSTNSKKGIAKKAHQDDLEGDRDLFLAKFSEKSEGKLLWSTYYGGKQLEARAELAVRGNNEIYLAGETESNDHIATKNARFDHRAGGVDLFVARFDGKGDRKWATYFGGEDDDTDASVDVLGDEGILLGGTTESDDKIAKDDPFQSKRKGDTDLFLALLDEDLDEGFDEDVQLATGGCDPGEPDPSLGLFLACIPLAFRPRRYTRLSTPAV